MNRSDRNSSDPQDPISDDQLDQLLGLARPQLERGRQRRLRGRVVRMLVADRGSIWAGMATSRCVAAVACFCLMGWLGWSVWPGSDLSPVAERGNLNSPAASVAPMGSVAIDRQRPRIKFTEQAADIRRGNVRAMNGSRRLASANSFFPNDGRLAVAVSDLSDAMLLKLSVSPVGLRMLELATLEINRADTEYGRLNQRDRSRLGKADRERVRQLVAVKSLWFAMESRLVSRVQQGHPDLAVASFRVLCRCGSQRTLPLVLSKWQEPAVRSEVVAAAGRLADARTLTRLVGATDDFEMRTRMMTQLLCRDDARSVDSFLKLTAKYGLFTVAQASGRRAGCVRTDVLLARLQSNRMSIARAAAITLSEIDDSRITEQLLELANRPQTRQAAVMALTARRDASAQRFVTQASTNIGLLATVGNARRKWDRLLAVN